MKSVQAMKVRAICLTGFKPENPDSSSASRGCELSVASGTQLMSCPVFNSGRILAVPQNAGAPSRPEWAGPGLPGTGNKTLLQFDLFQAKGFPDEFCAGRLSVERDKRHLAENQAAKAHQDSSALLSAARVETAT